MKFKSTVKMTVRAAGVAPQWAFENSWNHIMRLHPSEAARTCAARALLIFRAHLPLFEIGRHRNRSSTRGRSPSNKTRTPCAHRAEMHVRHISSQSRRNAASSHLASFFTHPEISRPDATMRAALWLTLTINDTFFSLLLHNLLGLQ